MFASFLSVLFLGFVLGIKHSIEPDHVIAVATIVRKRKKWWYSTLTGVFWGVGHTSTLFLAGMTLVLMKGEIPLIWTMSLEFLVGMMLVYLGIRNMLIYKRNLKDDKHNPAYEDKMPFLKSTFIGFIHGLAGSAAMILLTMSTVSTVWEGALYILVFGAGTILGMLCFTTIIGIPFTYSKKSSGLDRFFTSLAGTVSFGFGIYYMYNLGIAEGLFKMWVQ